MSEITGRLDQLGIELPEPFTAILASLRSELGDLDRVESWVRS